MMEVKPTLKQNSNGGSQKRVSNPRLDETDARSHMNDQRPKPVYQMNGEQSDKIIDRPFI